MNHAVPTIRVKRDRAPGYSIINAADFDPAKHQRWADPLDHDGDGKKGGAKPAKAKRKGDEEAGDPPLTRREIEADLVGMGEDFDPAADLADLRKQRDDARAILEA
jgi:hypothetical protein